MSKTGSETENLIPDKNQEFRSTRYRWVILTSVVLSIVSNAISVSTLSPVAIQIQEAYNVRSVTFVNICAISFAICSAPFTLLAIWATARFRLTYVLRIASMLQLIGILIRDCTMINDQFWPMVPGIFVQVAATPFFLNTQAMIANRWFPDN